MSLYPTLSRPARRQRGVALLDALIAMVVVAVGVVSLARLQGVSLREGGSAKAKAVATQLAQEKLDDLRSFTQLETGGNGVFGFDDIGANAGGAENANGSLRIASGNVTVSGTAYARSWTATGYYYCSTGAVPGTTNCAGANKVRPDFRSMRITVSWTDADGTARDVKIDGTVNASDPMTSASALVTGSSSEKPLVGYRPGAAPEVIAIDIGGGQKVETTNPAPTLNVKGHDIINIIAHYSTIKYSSDTNTISRQEFTTVNCSCRQAGTDTAYNLAGEEVSKRTGEPADNNQASECTICCRDHHDDSSCASGSSSGKINCYDPFRPTSDYHATGDHKHYTANGQSADGQGDVYVEACRFVRTDGYQRVTRDWRLSTLSAIPQSYFEGSGSAANIDAYGEYVTDYVKAEIAGGTHPTPPWSSAATVNKNTSGQMNARGLYIDYLDDATKANLAARLNANDETAYQEIPFYDVNLTKLVQWSSANQSVAKVTNDQLKTEGSGQNLYSRGDVTGVNYGVVAVKAQIKASNTGVIDQIITTDPDDGTNSLSGMITVTVPGSNPTISGTITPLISGNVLLSVSGGNGQCSYSAASGAYTCSVSYGSTGTITPSAAGYTFSPLSYSFTVQTTGLTDKDFVSTTSAQSHLLSGGLSPAVAGSAVSGAGALCSVDLAGRSFTCTVADGWSGVLSAGAPGYSFVGSGCSYSAVTADNAGCQFAGSAVSSYYSISGSFSPMPAGSVTVVASGGGSCSVIGGNYSCSVPNGWSGDITPSAANTTFTPGLKSFASLSGNQVFDFSTTISNFMISGRITPTTTGVSLAASNGGSCTFDPAGAVDASTYSCTVPNGWSGSITPSASNKSFTPSSLPYSNVTSAQGGQNYQWTNATPATFTVTGSITGLDKNTSFASGTNFSGSSGASCALGTRSVSGNDATYPYTCTVTISAGTTWSGSVTMLLTPASNKTVTLTAGSATATKTGAQASVSWAFSGISSNQAAKNFSCSGNGC